MSAGLADKAELFRKLHAGLGQVQRVAKALRESRDAAAVYEGAIPFVDVNRLLIP